MTAKEKLMAEHPDYLTDECMGGCVGCPSSYNYLPKPSWCNTIPEVCTRCWNREIPEPSKNIPTVFWDQVYKLIEEAVKNRDRSVYIYFNPETGASVSVEPWPDANTPHEMYEKSDISQ